MIKIPRGGQWIAPTVKRIARMYFLGNSTLATILIVVLLLVSCGAVDRAGGGNGSASPGNNGTDFTGQHVHIVGSTALLPLAAKAADLFHQQHAELKIDALGGGSVTGLSSVTSHQADIGDSDIYADPALYPDPNLTDHIVCVNVFTLMINPAVNISSLNTQQVINIFTGITTNWKQVGGPDLAITPVIRPTTSGTRALFDKYVMGGAQQVGVPQTSDSSTTIIDTVAHTPGAVGYVAVTSINPTVKAVSLNGVNAEEQNVKNGTYPFWGYEHMYTLQNGINATTAFLDFMQTPQIQQLAQQLGYISVSDIHMQQK
ncbi:MAG TPA: substrate-binding domain-containing protein [Ktedonobacteraceae bacterium]|nr:substrate-binding domain-containing protein [Ktedonobacteraceae bacterium]